MSAGRDDLAVAHERRRDRQRRCMAWAERTYGENARSRRILALRLVEEAVELGQAQGLTAKDFRIVLKRVLGRKPGDTKQEIGGLMVVLYCLAENLGLDVDGCEATEINRVHAAPLDELKAKEAEKFQQGLL